MKCTICKSLAKEKFHSKILNKYEIKYYYCLNCHFLFTEKPFWLNEAYNNTITISDTGILERSLHFARIIPVILYFFFGKDEKYLDYAGGYGIFTRRMRDIGFDFYWYDLYSENLVAKGFEFTKKNNKIKLATCFESLEHFVDPIKEIKEILKISPNIIFSTQIIPNPVPKPGEWEYYGCEHGQHISFYSIKSFSWIADQLKLHYYPLKHNLHFFSENKFNFFLLKFLTNRFINFLLSKFIKKKMRTRLYSDNKKMMNFIEVHKRKNQE